MSSEILFISDLHLTLEKPEITRRFLLFLEYRAPKAKALYILGDLFDAWIGDDDPTPPNNKIRQQLKQLTSSGTNVFLQLGNRDFLMGERFCRETGITMLEDYALIDLCGEPTLLTHGDLLCTDDVPYQAFRKKSRTEEWQQNILSKPLFLRLLGARWYRLRSLLHKRKKKLEIMDVSQQTIVEVMRKHNVLRLIHGHTHRPAVHELEIDGKAAHRFVLAQWTKNSGSVLCWRDNKFKVETL